MPTFTMTTDNNISVFENEAHVLANTPPEGFEVIAATQKAFAKATENWTIARFVEVWNGFAGVPPFGKVQPVKKFTDRKTAVTRIWETIQILGDDLLARKTAANAVPAATRAPKKEKAAKHTTAKAAAPTARAGSKKAIVLEMIGRKGGATLNEIIAATGWQKHTVRGFMAGTLKKAGLAVESSKSEAGERTYKLAK